MTTSAKDEAKEEKKDTANKTDLEKAEEDNSKSAKESATATSGPATSNGQKKDENTKKKPTEAAAVFDERLGHDWSETEVDAMKVGLRQHGQNWSVISEKIKTKTAEQCKAFYQNMRKKHGFDRLVYDYSKANNR